MSVTKARVMEPSSFFTARAPHRGDRCRRGCISPHPRLGHHPAVEGEGRGLRFLQALVKPACGGVIGQVIHLVHQDVPRLGVVLKGASACKDHQAVAAGEDERARGADAFHRVVLAPVPDDSGVGITDDVARRLHGPGDDGLAVISKGDGFPVSLGDDDELVALPPGVGLCEYGDRLIESDGGGLGLLQTLVQTGLWRRRRSGSTSCASGYDAFQRHTRRCVRR